MKNRRASLRIHTKLRRAEATIEYHRSRCLLRCLLNCCRLSEFSFFALLTTTTSQTLSNHTDVRHLEQFDSSRPRHAQSLRICLCPMQWRLRGTNWKTPCCPPHCRWIRLAVVFQIFIFPNVAILFIISLRPTTATIVGLDHSENSTVRVRFNTWHNVENWLR